MGDEDSSHVVGRLRRDLGTLESYAALIGILIGAGIFTVTSHAWSLTGPSVILGHALLIPAVLATSVPYAAYLSTPLGRTARDRAREPRLLLRRARRRRAVVRAHPDGDVRPARPLARRARRPGS